MRFAGTFGNMGLGSFTAYRNWSVQSTQVPQAISRTAMRRGRARWCAGRVGGKSRQKKKIYQFHVLGMDRCWNTKNLYARLYLARDRCSIFGSCWAVLHAHSFLNVGYMSTNDFSTSKHLFNRSSRVCMHCYLNLDIVCFIQRLRSKKGGRK